MDKPAPLGNVPGLSDFDGEKQPAAGGVIEFGAETAVERSDGVVCLFADFELSLADGVEVKVLLFAADAVEPLAVFFDPVGGELTFEAVGLASEEVEQKEDPGSGGFRESGGESPGATDQGNGPAGELAGDKREDEAGDEGFDYMDEQKPAEEGGQGGVEGAHGLEAETEHLAVADFAFAVHAEVVGGEAVAVGEFLGVLVEDFGAYEPNRHCLWGVSAGWGGTLAV